jgi:hypothetical protein
MKRLVLALLVLLPARLWAGPPELAPEVRAFVKVDAPSAVLPHVRVIDGTGAPAREDHALVLADGRIQSIGRTGDVAVPKDAQGTPSASPASLSPAARR